MIVFAQNPIRLKDATQSTRGLGPIGVFLAGIAILLAPTLRAADADLPASENRRVVFKEDFESGTKRWQLLDPKTWRIRKHSDGHSFEITARKSQYKPPTRSPGHVALVKDLKVGNCEIRFRVRSTKDTGNHRDCCVFFSYQNPSQFYYVHLGAKPDPHSGQIMIVDEAPRKALTKNEKKTPWDDDWHEVLVRRNIETGLIEVFFDDMTTPHMSVTDKTFGEGQVGIGSFDDLNEFDDLTVSTF
ncbi:MAG: hypothetical protein AAF958_16345 [Planctomycetota bacterium]